MQYFSLVYWGCVWVWVCGVRTRHSGVNEVTYHRAACTTQTFFVISLEQHRNYDFALIFTLEAGKVSEVFEFSKVSKWPCSHWANRAIPENREFKKWKFSFFHQRHALLTSFDIFVVTYRVKNFLPKLLDMLLFSTEKTEFPFLVFHIFGLYRPTVL